MESFEVVWRTIHGWRCEGFRDITQALTFRNQLPASSDSFIRRVPATGGVNR
jgi:hypothetical protein